MFRTRATALSHGNQQRDAVPTSLCRYLTPNWLKGFPGPTKRFPTPSITPTGPSDYPLLAEPTVLEFAETLHGRAVFHVKPDMPAVRTQTLAGAPFHGPTLELVESRAAAVAG